MLPKRRARITPGKRRQAIAAWNDFLAPMPAEQDNPVSLRETRKIDPDLNLGDDQQTKT